MFIPPAPISQVYELSCDVAAAAGRGAAPELLKALHGLVGDGGLEAAVYEPALSQGSGTAGGGGAGEEAGADSAAAGSSAVGTPGTGQGAGSTLAAGSSTRSTSEERVSPLAHASARAAEMAAAHVLFFACVPTQTDKGELVALLRAKPPKGVLAHWGSPEVTYSMQVRCDACMLHGVAQGCPGLHALFGQCCGGSCTSSLLCGHACWC